MREDNYNKFAAVKWLLDIPVGGQRSITNSKVSYTSLKSICTQQKNSGKGIWHVSKGIGCTTVTREK